MRFGQPRLDQASSARQARGMIRTELRQPRERRPPITPSCCSTAFTRANVPAASSRCISVISALTSPAR